MKTRLIAIMLILTLALTAVLMCACGENEGAGSKDEPIELSEDMTLEEVLDAWKDAKSITLNQTVNYSESLEVGYNNNKATLKITPNAVLYSLTLNEYWQRDIIMLYEDGILYQFYEYKEYTENNVLCGELHNYSAQQVTLDDIDNGNFTILSDIDDSVFHYIIIAFAKYLEQFTISNYLKQAMVEVSDDELPDGMHYDISYSIQDNNLIYNIEVWVDGELMQKTANKFSDINTTTIDIPERYADYKSLELTE